MKRGIYALALLALFMISVVSAADTMIKIKTLPEHDVDVYALRVGETYNLIESFHKKSDSNGSASVVLSTDEEKFNLRIDVRKDNVKIASEKFNKTYTSGETIGVEVYPEWYWEQLAIEQGGNFADGAVTTETSAIAAEEDVSDEAIMNETQEEKTSNSSAITGFFTSIKENVSGKALSYSIIFIVLIGALGMFFKRKKGHTYYEPAEPKEIKVVKMSELKERSEKGEENKGLIEDVERKISELQEQVKKMKEI